MSESNYLGECQGGSACSGSRRGGGGPAAPRSAPGHLRWIECARVRRAVQQGFGPMHLPQLAATGLPGPHTQPAPPVCFLLSWLLLQPCAVARGYLSAALPWLGWLGAGHHASARDVSSVRGQGGAPGAATCGRTVQGWPLLLMAHLKLGEWALGATARVVGRLERGSPHNRASCTWGLLGKTLWRGGHVLPSSSCVVGPLLGVHDPGARVLPDLVLHVGCHAAGRLRVGCRADSDGNQLHVGFCGAVCQTAVRL